MKSVLFLAVLGHVQSAAAAYNPWSVLSNNAGQWSEVIERDVCIVGGGASGVHAAVSLLDLNKTVVVVERNDRLGGDTHTYLDPETGAPLDIGVVVHQPIPIVLDFFAKFNVSLVNMTSTQSNEPGQPANLSLPAIMFSTTDVFTDFRDGSNVVRTVDPALEGALGRMTAVLSNYMYILDGYDLPDPVPEDLYIPYGAFLEKYNLTAAFQIAYQISQGMGDLLHIPTIYAIKYFNVGDIKALSQGYVTQAQGNTSEVYTRAGAYIGASNVLLQSTVISANRQNTTSGRPELLVSSRDEGLKLLSCNQILLTIEPNLSNLDGWDLTPEEYAVFSQYVNANGYWTGLVKNVGLNQTVTHVNAAANTPFNIPVLPALYNLSPVGILDDVWWIKFGANTPTMSDVEVQAYVKREIQTIQRVNNVTITDPEWLIFESHSPFHLQVSSEAIKDGFFKNLTALQGGLDGKMFYSGAAFHTQYTTLLWRFNHDVVIPKMLGSS